MLTVGTCQNVCLESATSVTCPYLCSKIKLVHTYVIDLEGLTYDYSTTIVQCTGCQHCVVFTK